MDGGIKWHVHSVGMLRRGRASPWRSVLLSCHYKVPTNGFSPVRGAYTEELGTINATSQFALTGS